MASAGDVARIAETALQVFFNADNITADKLQQIADNVKTIFHNFRVESFRIRNFHLPTSKSWEGKVIDISEVIDNIQEMWAEAREIIDDKGKSLVAPFTEFIRTLKLISVSEEIPDPQGGPSKFAKAFDELHAFITELNKLIGSVEVATREVANMGTLFNKILGVIEDLEGIVKDPENNPPWLGTSRPKGPLLTYSYRKRGT